MPACFPEHMCSDRATHQRGRRHTAPASSSRPTTSTCSGAPEWDAAMTRYLVVAEREGLGRAARNDRRGLEGLRRGAQEHERAGVAYPSEQRPAGVRRPR